MQVGSFQHHHIRPRKLSRNCDVRCICKTANQADNTQTALQKIIDVICKIFHADRAWLLTSCDANTAMWSVPAETIYKDASGQSVSMRDVSTVACDEMKSLFITAQASSDPIVSQVMPDNVFSRYYSIYSQMVMIIHGRSGQSWMLGIHQCTFTKNWSAQERTRFKDVGDRIKDLLDAWYLDVLLGHHTLQYHALMEQIDDGIVIIQNKHIVYANKNMYTMLGIPVQTAIADQNILKYVHPDHHSVVLLQYINARKNKPNSPYKMKLMNADGKILEVVLISAKIMFNQMPGVQMAIKDITQDHIQKDMHTMKLNHRKLIWKINHQQEEERATIARDLHDDLGALLTAVSLNLESMKALTKKDAVAKRITETEDIVKALFKSVRYTLTSLDLTHLNQDNFIENLRHQIGTWSQQHRIMAILNIDDALEISSHETMIAIFRITQEAITNIAQHAYADQMNVSLGFTSSGKPSNDIMLQIEDNGCGFDTESIKSSRFGLAGIQARAEQISASCIISSQIGRGSTLKITFPSTRHMGERL